jgi:hypothetical protein
VFVSIKPFAIADPSGFGALIDTAPRRNSGPVGTKGTTAKSAPRASNKGLGTVIQVIQEPSCDALLKPKRLISKDDFAMAMIWLSIALGVLGFAAIMFAIPPDDAQLLGEFPEFDPRYRGWTDGKL